MFCDTAFNSDFGQAGVVFYNQGTLQKLASTNSTVFSPNGSQDILINNGLDAEINPRIIEIEHYP